MILNHRDLQEINQVIQNSPISKEVSQKFIDPKPANQDHLMDSYELIDKNECHPVCCACQCQVNQRPLRAFSLGNLEQKASKFKKHFLPHQTLAPADVSQSCNDIPDCDTARTVHGCGQIKGQCGCHGACNHTPLPVMHSREVGMWVGSKDSGMESSQENGNLAESLKEAEEIMRATQKSPAQAKQGMMREYLSLLSILDTYMHWYVCYCIIQHTLY